jgi:hypothetical protein
MPMCPARPWSAAPTSGVGREAGRCHEDRGRPTAARVIVPREAESSALDALKCSTPVGDAEVVAVVGMTSGVPAVQGRLPSARSSNTDRRRAVIFRSTRWLPDATGVRRQGRRVFLRRRWRSWGSGPFEPTQPLSIMRPRNRSLSVRTMIAVDWPCEPGWILPAGARVDVLSTDLIPRELVESPWPSRSRCRAASPRTAARPPPPAPPPRPAAWGEKPGSDRERRRHHAGRLAAGDRHSLPLRFAKVARSGDQRAAATRGGPTFWWNTVSRRPRHHDLVAPM